MTTIAYKAGVIAFDSRITIGTGDITVLDYDKSRQDKGCHFFFAGSMADVEEFMGYYAGEDADNLPLLDCVAFVLDGGRLYLSGINDDGHLWRDPYSLKQHAAIGSGAPYALTAMDLGCDAKTAVKMAMLRDSHTGGRIRTYKIPHFK